MTDADRPHPETHVWARRVLAAEEHVLASCLVDYNGTVAPNHAHVDAAIAEIGAKVPFEPPDENCLLAFPVAKRMALLLTPTRFLVYALGFGNTPKRFLGPVPLAAVTEIRTRGGAFGEQMSIVMRSGAIVDVERRDGDPCTTFVAHFGELTPGA